MPTHSRRTLGLKGLCSMSSSMENFESVQLINTAIIKTKEKSIDRSYEKRLSDVCQSDALKAINFAITHLSESSHVSRDQAAIQIIETLRELDSIWTDYVLMEGIGKLKELLNDQPDNTIQ